MTHTSNDPSRFEANTIFSPSGDQDGDWSDAGLFVMRTGEAPLACIRYSSSLPSRLDVKPIWDPFGDQVAFLSSAALFVRSV